MKFFYDPCAVCVYVSLEYNIRLRHKNLCVSKKKNRFMKLDVPFSILKDKDLKNSRRKCAYETPS